jgi:16S rRNA (uracil1498-N3)-methyltransferase
MCLFYFFVVIQIGMNLILLFEKDFIEPGIVRITGRRQKHIQKVHRAAKGDFLNVGLLNSQMGTAEILDINSTFVEMKVNLERDPPTPLPLTIVLALPRPKMLKRILETITSLGIKEIYIINSWRVEKSFWLSPSLQMEKLENSLILGLEQSKDTVMPNVYLKRLFKPFITQELPALAKNKIALTAHPGVYDVCPRDIKKESILVMGPEGGFIDLEIESLEKIGFKTVTLGERILRMEVAVPVLISRLY